MIEIPLNPKHKGYITKIDDIDSDLIQFGWNASTIRPDCPCPYAFRQQRHEGKKKYFALHRIILARKLGRELLKHEWVDHIDGNPLNNCRSNLRLCSETQNHWNSRKPMTNTSGYKGAFKRKNCWYSMIKVNGQQIYLGQFPTAEAAHTAYCEAAKKYHGEFARIE